MKTRSNSISVHVAATRALAAEGLTADEIGERLGKTANTIRAYAAEYGIALVRPKADAVRARAKVIRQLAAEGRTASQIGMALGLSAHDVHAIARRTGIVIRPETGLERAQRLRRLAAAGHVKGHIPVPKWVHPSLKGEYRDFTADLGEDEAARRIRRLQHDMHGGQAA